MPKYVVVICYVTWATTSTNAMWLRVSVVQSKGNFECGLLHRSCAAKRELEYTTLNLLNGESIKTCNVSCTNTLEVKYDYHRG